jgi:hypothetical protein
MSGDRAMLPLPKNKRSAPNQPRRGHGPGTIAWRCQRMISEPAQAIYCCFAAERPRAHMRITLLLVRSIDRAKTVVLWHIHAFNFVHFKRLGLT